MKGCGYSIVKHLERQFYEVMIPQHQCVKKVFKVFKVFMNIHEYLE
jgi:hypothetical protein